MAWDSSSFPWEWDGETFHLPNHGTGTDIRKSSGNNRSLEADFYVGKNGVSFHITKELGPSMPTTGASLAKDDASQLDWHASPHMNGHANGVHRDAVPTTGTTSSIKRDALQVDWQVSRYSNETGREGGLAVPTAGSTSSTKQDALHVDWHVSRFMNGLNKEGPMMCPASTSKVNESNSSWRHANEYAGSAESTCNMIPSTGMGGHCNASCSTTGILPIVTTCTGIANGPFVGLINSSGGAQSSENAVQRGVNDSWKKTEHGFAGVFKPNTEQAGVMQHTHQQITASNLKSEVSAIKLKEEKGVSSTSKGARVHQMDEQHSSNATGSAGSGDSFTGLHLGKRTYSQDGSKATASKPAQRAVPAPKKARTGIAIPRCQVEGCKLDLTSAKDYHRRHKVCEPHSKAGKVVVAGTEQRFCQQCSRFHLLPEFDEAKRSCRRRLAGHNERRRKPQPDPLALHARLHSTFEDWPFLHQSRFSRMPLLWQDLGDFRSDGLWPRTTTGLFENHSACDYTMQGPAAERQSYLKSLSQPLLSYHDKLSLLLLQSPKSVMSNNAAYPRVQHYPIEGLGGLMGGDSLTLAPSSTGVGALPGLDTTPVTRGVTRVSDSGRALSLLSLQTRGSQAPDVLMPDPPGLASIAAFNHQLGHHEEVNVPQQFLLQGGPQYFDDVSVDKTMISMSLSNSQPQSGSAHVGSLMSFDRDLDECSFGHDLNRQASNHPLFALLPYHQENGLSQAGQHEGAGG